METTEPQKSFLYDTLLPKIEPISWGLALIGFAAAWSLMHWGNTLLLLGGMGLGFSYFMQFFTPTQPNVNDTPYRPTTEAGDGKAPSFLLDALAPKYANIGSAVLVVGSVFKLLNFNGSAAMLLVGTMSVIGAVVLLAIGRNLSLRILLVALLGCVMLYVPSETLVRQFHRDDPALAEKMVYQLQHPRDTAATAAVRRHLQQKRAAR